MFLPRNEGAYRHMRLNYKVKTAKKNKFYWARFHYLHISFNFSYLLIKKNFLFLVGRRTDIAYHQLNGIRIVRPFRLFNSIAYVNRLM